MTANFKQDQSIDDDFNQSKMMEILLSKLDQIQATLLRMDKKDLTY